MTMRGTLVELLDITSETAKIIANLSLQYPEEGERDIVERGALLHVTAMQLQLAGESLRILEEIRAELRGENDSIADAIRDAANGRTKKNSIVEDLKTS